MGREKKRRAFTFCSQSQDSGLAAKWFCKTNDDSMGSPKNLVGPRINQLGQGSVLASELTQLHESMNHDYVRYSLTYFVTPLTVASAVKRLPALSMAIPSPIAPSGVSVLCAGTNIITLPSFKLPIRMPLSQPGCLFGSDSESAA